MKIMFFVYVLKSEKDHDLYVGRTENIELRVDDHNMGRVESTKNRKPLKLIYYEASRNAKDAAHREIYLKTAWGKRFLKQRFKNDL